MCRKQTKLALWTGTILHLLFVAAAEFSWQQCLGAHNALRAKHENTSPLKYSKDLEKEAQVYANTLAGRTGGSGTSPTRRLPKRRAIPGPTIPFNHKEMWDGEIVFPKSGSGLNAARNDPIGESIHKFCCYSHPFCPPEFFYNLQFPPSAKGVTEHFYSEIKNYDFSKGIKKSSSSSSSEEIVHFTNIVWRKTSEIGCAQSKKSSDHCIYTIVRYRTQGSVGLEETFKENVQPLKKTASARKDSGQSYLVGFLVALFVVFLFVGVVVFIYFKRDKFKQIYLEWKIKRDARKAEAELRGDDYYENERRQSFGQNVIFKPSARKKDKFKMEIVTNTVIAPAVPFRAREPTITRREIVIMPGALMNGKPMSTLPTETTAPQQPKSSPVYEPGAPVHAQAKQPKPEPRVPKIEIKVDKPEPSDIKQRSPLPVPRQHRPSSAEQDRPKSPSGRPPSPIPAPRPGRPVSAGTSASEEQSRPKPVPRNKSPNFRSFPVPDKHNDENKASTQEISAVAQRRGSFEPNGPENQKPVVPLKRPDVPGERPHSDVPSGKPMVKPGADRRVTPLKRPEVPVKRSHSDVTPPPKPDIDKAKRPSLPPTAENPSADGPVTNLKRPEVPVKRSHSDVTPPPKPGKDKAKRPLLPPTLEDPTNENMKKPLPAGRELKRPVVPPVNEKSKKPILPPGKAGKKPLLPPEKQRKPLLAPKTENEDENSERPLTVSERRRLLEQQGQR